MKKKFKTAQKFSQLFYFDFVNRLFHKSCRVRQTDILVGSFPKSGRTWIRFFLSAYISDYYQLGIRTNWDNFEILTPSPLCKKIDGLLSPSRYLEYRVIVCHEKRIGRYFPGRKTIFITRNFLDILISYYFFHKNRNRSYYSALDLDEFVLNEFDLGSAISRINYFSKQIEQASEYLILPYEVMRNDPETKLKELIDFTYYQFNYDIFRSALEQSSFSSMRKMEVEQRQYETTEQFHTREGGIFKFRDHLKPETISLVENLLEEQLHPPLRDFYLLNQL